MRVIAPIEPALTWPPGHRVRDQVPAVAAHLEFMRARCADGSLLLGRPLRDGSASPRGRAQHRRHRGRA